MATFDEIRAKLRAGPDKDLIKKELEQYLNKLQHLTDQYKFKKSHRYIWIEESFLSDVDAEWDYDVDPLYIALLCEIVYQKTAKKYLTPQITMDLIRYQEAMEYLDEVIESYFEDEKFFASEQFQEEMRRQAERD